MDEDDHTIFMQEALSLAEHARDLGEVPIGAVIVKEGKIIGRGYNRREIDKNPLGHAELMAIEEASKKLTAWRLEGCRLYVTLEPCPMCAGAIIQSRIDTVIYGTEDPKSGYAGSLHNTLQDSQLNHQTEVLTGVMQEECQQMLKDFFRCLREQKSQLKRNKKKEGIDT
jgi:tRNA(adenine34) deaminase